MPGQYTSLEALVQGEREWGAVQERARVVRVLNGIIERHEQGNVALGLAGNEDIERLMKNGLTEDVSWADLVAVAVPQILTSARNSILK